MRCRSALCSAVAESVAELQRVIDVVAFQAAACTESSSPLYGRVLDAVVDDLRAGGATGRVLGGRGEDPFGSALALRFLGAVHRIVLEGRAPDLAAQYPSAGGRERADLEATFLATVEEHESEIATLIEDGVQTNEVGRSAVLVGGYATVTHRTYLPLRILEVGASAGLNLRWDHFAYDTGRIVSGDPESPVRFSGVWVGEPHVGVGPLDGRGHPPRDLDGGFEASEALHLIWPHVRHEGEATFGGGGVQRVAVTTAAVNDLEPLREVGRVALPHP